VKLTFILNALDFLESYEIIFLRDKEESDPTNHGLPWQKHKTYKHCDIQFFWLFGFKRPF